LVYSFRQSELAPFLSTELVTKKYSGIDSPYNYGEVLHTGYVDTAVLLEKYREYEVIFILE
jgi:hypothetical protein